MQQVIDTKQRELSQIRDKERASEITIQGLENEVDSLSLLPLPFLLSSVSSSPLLATFLLSAFPSSPLLSSPPHPILSPSTPSSLSSPSSHLLSASQIRIVRKQTNEIDRMWKAGEHHRIINDEPVHYIKRADSASVQLDRLPSQKEVAEQNQEVKNLKKRAKVDCPMSDQI